MKARQRMERMTDHQSGGADEQGVPLRLPVHFLGSIIHAPGARSRYPPALHAHHIRVLGAHPPRCSASAYSWVTLTESCQSRYTDDGEELLQIARVMLTYEQLLDRDPGWALREGSMHFENDSAVHKTL